MFKLGRTYKTLLEELGLGGNVFDMHPIDPESLIYRFAKQLEFGTQMMQVAGEAVRIVQRMNRDWMITGRRPAGVCGAALVIAARMNNFRRTVREVVYVVKVTESTIMQRLNEFKVTESGELTVDEFRTVDLERSHDPPAFTRAKLGIKKRKRGGAPETAGEIEGDEDVEEELEEATPGRATSPKRRRVDADGFAIPDFPARVPIDPALLAADRNKSANEENGEVETAETQPKRAKRNLPPPTKADIAREDELEQEMQTLLSSDSELLGNAKVPNTLGTELPPDGFEEEDFPIPAYTKAVSDSEIIDPAEFDDDLEVQFCLLTPNEVKVKEGSWVTDNKDYLRAQQAKALKKALLEADYPDGHIQKPRKRRKGRMGDVSYLQGPDGSRASTPAEATRMMLEQRGFSKKINYKLLEEIYGDDVDGKTKGKITDLQLLKTVRESNGSRTPSRNPSRSLSRSRSASVTSERSTGAYSNYGHFGGGAGRISARTRLNKGMKAAKAAAAAGGPLPSFGNFSRSRSRSRAATSASPAPSSSPAPTSTAARSVPVRVPVSRQPAPAPEPELEPEQPVDPDEEILGFVGGPEPSEQSRNYEMEDEEDEDEDEDEEGGEKDSRIDAAFAGDYYDEGSDDGYGYEEV